jgi:hypothetical protein
LSDEAHGRAPRAAGRLLDAGPEGQPPPRASHERTLSTAVIGLPFQASAPFARSALKTDQELKLTERNSVAIVERFWDEVWKQPQNPGAIDKLVAEEFVITSGGIDIVSREAFKAWVTDFQSKVLDMEFESVETFQSPDGRRVACRWRLTGRNNGIMGTKPDGAPFEMVGTAVWEVDEDGLLRHNWVERNAWEVYGTLTNKPRAF